MRPTRRHGSSPPPLTVRVSTPRTAVTLGGVKISLSVHTGLTGLLTRAVVALESLAVSSHSTQTTMEDAVTDLTALTDATTRVAALIGEVGQKLSDYLVDVNTTLDELRAQVAGGEIDQATLDAAVSKLQSTIEPLNEMRDELVEASNDDTNEVPPITTLDEPATPDDDTSGDEAPADDTPAGENA